MTLTAAIPQLRPPPCKKFSSDCQEPQGWQLAFLFGALGLLSIGAGGIRPCNIAFGADQFDTSTPKGRSQLECFFNWIPESMRTVAGALFFLCLAGTGYVSSLVVNVIHRTSGGGGKTPWLGGHDLNKNRLDYYYYTIAGLACLNFIYFHLIASRFATEDNGGGRRREEDELENAGGNGGGGEASEHKAGGALISGDAC
ncbi:Protein NRT1/ PTR FAMILY 2.8 [Linum perenne]